MFLAWRLMLVVPVSVVTAILVTVMTAMRGSPEWFVYFLVWCIPLVYSVGLVGGTLVGQQMVVAEMVEPTNDA